MSQNVFGALKNPQIGQLIEGQGIYMGSLVLSSKAGCGEKGTNNGEKRYAVFAAPEDLNVPNGNPKDLYSRNGKQIAFDFSDAALEISILKNWHGHDGGRFSYDDIGGVFKEIAEKNEKSYGGPYKGEWFIPPEDFVIGGILKDGKPCVVSLFDAKDIGAFKGTFTTTGNNERYCSFITRYMTSTIVDTDSYKCIETESWTESQGKAARLSILTYVDFADGSVRSEDYFKSGFERTGYMRVRPIRLEPIPG